MKSRVPNVGILFAIWFVMLMQHVNGQQIFQRSYFTPGSNSEGRSMVKMNNGDYLVAGRAGIFTNSSDIYLLRLDSLGSILWSKTFSSPWSDMAVNLTHTGDSNLIMTCLTYGIPVSGLNYSVSHLVKLDGAGNVLWSKTPFDTITKPGFSLSKTLDIGNNYYSIGVTFDYSSNSITRDTSQLGLLIKTDASGQFVWGRKYGKYKTVITDFVKSPDNGLVITGYTETWDTVIDNQLFYFKIDSSGYPLWAHKWDPYHAKPRVIIDAADGYLIGGIYGEGPPNFDAEGFIIKIDYSGNVKWSKKYGNLGTGHDEVAALCKLTNGNLLFSRGGVVIVKTDSTGNQINQRSLINFPYSKVYELHGESFNGVSGIGSTGYTFHVFKTDSLLTNCYNQLGTYFSNNLPLNVQPFAFNDSAVHYVLNPFMFNSSNPFSSDSVFCLTASSIIEKDKLYRSIRIQPNPAKDIVELVFEDGGHGVVDVGIYNLHGKIMMNKSRMDHDDNKIDISALSQGVYIVKINIGIKLFAFKIVKI